MPDNTECDDTDACTHSDACHGGVCLGLVSVCNDNDPCTSDQCDSLLGCIFEDLNIPDCASLPPGTLPTPAPTPLTEQDTELVGVIPQVEAPPPPDNQAGSIVLGGYEEAVDEQAAADNVEDKQESENDVLASSSLSLGASAVGLSAVACAGCLAMFFGAIAANKSSESEDDRLENMLLANDTHIDMNAVVENDAFIG